MSLGLSFRLYLEFPSKAALVLGILQALLGILSIVLAVAGFVQKIWGHYMGTGIWCGVAVFIDGLCGIIGGQTRTSCSVKTFFLVSLLSAILTFIMLVLSAGGLDYRSSFYYDAYYYAYYHNKPTKVLHGALLGLAIMQFALSIINALLCLKPTCQKKPGGKYKVPKNYSSPIVRSRPVENTDIPRGIVGGNPLSVLPSKQAIHGRYQSPRRPRSGASSSSDRNSHPLEPPTETTEFLPQQNHHDPDDDLAHTADSGLRRQKRRSRGSDSEVYQERTDEPYSASQRRDHQNRQSSTSARPERHTSSLHRDKQHKPRVRGRNSLETDRVRISDIESGMMRSGRNKDEYHPNAREMFRNPDSWVERAQTERPRPGRARRENLRRPGDPDHVNMQYGAPLAHTERRPGLHNQYPRVREPEPGEESRSSMHDQYPTVREPEFSGERRSGMHDQDTRAREPDPRGDRRSGMHDQYPGAREPEPRGDRRSGLHDQNPRAREPEPRGEPLRRSIGPRGSYNAAVNLMPTESADDLIDRVENEEVHVQTGGTGDRNSYIPPMVFGEEELPPYEEQARNQSPIYCTVGSLTASPASDFHRDDSADNSRLAEHGTSTAASTVSHSLASHVDEEVQEILGTRNRLTPDPHNSLSNDTEQDNMEYEDNESSISHGQSNEIPFIDDTLQGSQNGKWRRPDPPPDIVQPSLNLRTRSSRRPQERPSNESNLINNQRTAHKIQAESPRGQYKKRSKPVRTDSFTQTTPPNSVDHRSTQQEAPSHPVVDKNSPQRRVAGRQNSFKISVVDQSDRGQSKPLESSETPSYALPPPKSSSPAYFRRAEHDGTSDVLPSYELDDIPDIGIQKSFRASFPQHLGKSGHKRGPVRLGIAKTDDVEKPNSSAGSVNSAKEMVVNNTYGEELSSSFPLLGAVGGIDFGISDQESYLHSPVSTACSFSLEELKPRQLTSSPYRRGDKSSPMTGMSVQNLTDSDAEPENRAIVVETVNVGVALPTRSRPKHQGEANIPTASNPVTSFRHIQYNRENMETPRMNNDERTSRWIVDRQPRPQMSAVPDVSAENKISITPQNQVTSPKFFYPPERLPSQVHVDGKQEVPRYPSLDIPKNKPNVSEAKVEVPCVPALPSKGYHPPRHDQPQLECKTNEGNERLSFQQTQPPAVGNSRPSDASVAFLAFHNTGFNRTGWVRQTYPSAVNAAHPVRNGPSGASHQQVRQKPVGRAAMRQVMRSEQAAQEEPLNLQAASSGAKPPGVTSQRYTPRQRYAVPAPADSLAPSSGGPPPYSEALPSSSNHTTQRHEFQQQNPNPPYRHDRADRSRRQPVFSLVL